MNNSPIKALLILLLACMFLSTAVIAADEEKTDNVAVVWQMDITDGKHQIFEDAIKSFHNLYNKKPGHANWNWYKVETGPDTGQYIARSANHNWADLDAMENIWDDDLGKFWTLNVAPLIENAEKYLTMGDDEIYHWTEGKKYKFYTLRDMHIKPGMDFSKHLKVIHETLQKGGFKNDYALSWNISGGYGNSATFVFPAESWADMAEPSPTFAEVMKKNMDEDDFDELLGNYRDSYKTARSRIVRALPDLNTK
ncbi:MAG: hypothetical protein IMF09_04775 [Proteobacteria bacterium]|nr:hypothetical protein [Pseudomonadota bacterium]